MRTSIHATFIAIPLILAAGAAQADSVRVAD